jgi:hypothetical protein
VKVGAPGSEKCITISSADLCDNKFIIITKEDGDLKAQKVGRQSTTAATVRLCAHDDFDISSFSGLHSGIRSLLTEEF